VDDAEFNVIMLQEVLGSRGFRNCMKALDGEKALEMTLAHKPDIVILDLMMPGMNGYEYCRRIRRMAEFDDMPILVLTMLKEPQERARAFDAGASDLVNKPVHVDELLARVTLHLRRKFSMGKLNRYREENEQELKAARKMQDMLLPGAETIRDAEQRHGLTIYSHSAPCANIGGDFWGMLELSPHELALFMVDFSGHGVTAALNTFRLHAIIMELKQRMADPGLFLTTLNERLSVLLGAEQFATMFCGVLDATADTLRYAAAGSPPPLIISEGGASAYTLDCRGVPLGVRSSQRYATREVPFERGDSLLLFSDALLEGVNETFQPFEDHFFSAYSWPCKEPSQVFQSLIADFYQHTGGVVADDLTVNLYFRNP
ncbi:MAG: fused response regulator/phosphatase, partial [Alphaproteobacteria bacterium]|nr:fused response regulator/phosphatase [Alphaproteobacteria bacterium]